MADRAHTPLVCHSLESLRKRRNQPTLVVLVHLVRNFPHLSSKGVVIISLNEGVFTWHRFLNFFASSILSGVHTPWIPTLLLGLGLLSDRLDDALKVHRPLSHGHRAMLLLFFLLSAMTAVVLIGPLFKVLADLLWWLALVVAQGGRPPIGPEELLVVLKRIQHKLLPLIVIMELHQNSKVVVRWYVDLVGIFVDDFVCPWVGVIHRLLGLPNEIVLMSDDALKSYQVRLLSSCRGVHPSSQSYFLCGVSLLLIRGRGSLLIRDVRRSIYSYWSIHVLAALWLRW